MGPNDYSGAFATQSPLQAFNDALTTGTNIRTVQLQQQQQDQALALQQQMRTDLTALAQNPTPQAIAAASLKYPQLSEQFKRSYDMLSEPQRQAKLDAVIPVYAAIQSGRHDIAAQQLRDRAAAMENSGQKDEAARTRAMADLIEQHPEQGGMTAGLLLSSVMGPEKFSTTFGQVGGEARAAADQPTKQRIADAEATIKEAAARAAPQKEQQGLEKGVWDIANTRSQIDERAKRLTLDADKLESEVKLKLTELNQKNNQLDDGAKKLVNENTVQAVAADQSATQMLDLANRLGQIGTSWGAGGSVSEWLKKTTGNQDAVTQLRQEYVRLRSTQVSKMLPPGPASDKDIQLAMAGFPPDTADPQQMAGFVRGMAKLQQYDAAISTAKAEWVNSVGHLGKPKTDIEVDGVKVPAGSTFTDFAKQFVQRKADERGAEQGAAVIQQRGYMRWATPGQ